MAGQALAPAAALAADAPPPLPSALSVTASLGMTTPTPVQRACIPPILAGRAAVGVAQTGSGKTAAFALPLLQRLAADPYGVHTLVLTPTRELAFQIGDQFVALGAGASVDVAVVVGGLDARAHARALAARPHVVVATPGRLADLIGEHEDVAAAFSRAAALVLDEADRLLAPSFAGELAAIARALPPARQTLLFSATLTPSLVTMRGDVMRGAFTFEVRGERKGERAAARRGAARRCAAHPRPPPPQAYTGLRTVDNLDEAYALIPAKVKDVYLAHAVAGVGEEDEDGGDACARRSRSTPPPPNPRSALVFCDTTRSCARLARTLAELGVRCAALHSGLAQKERLRALESFRARRVPILLATDVASRGLDIPSVDLVINYDVPSAPEDYVHRVGRTARAGRAGRALTLVTQYDVSLVQAIEARIGHQLVDARLDEGEVLKGITRVFKARRAAALAAADGEARDAARGVARRGGGGRRG